MQISRRNLMAGCAGTMAAEGKPLCANARYVIGDTEYAFWSTTERLSGPAEAVAVTKLVPASYQLTL